MTPEFYAGVGVGYAVGTFVWALLFTRLRKQAHAGLMQTLAKYKAPPV